MWPIGCLIQILVKPGEMSFVFIINHFSIYLGIVFTSRRAPDSLLFFFNKTQHHIGRNGTRQPIRDENALARRQDVWQDALVVSLHGGRILVMCILDGHVRAKKGSLRPDVAVQNTLLPPKFQCCTDAEAKPFVLGILPLRDDFDPEKRQHLRNHAI